jgi:hypothetical protein
VAIATLRQAVADKIGAEDAGSVVLKFTDEEGDVCVMTCDDTLVEAVDVCRNQGASVLKLSVETKKGGSALGAGGGGMGAGGMDVKIMGAVGVGIVGLVGIGLMAFRPRR